MELSKKFSFFVTLLFFGIVYFIALSCRDRNNLIKRFSPAFVLKRQTLETFDNPSKQERRNTSLSDLLTKDYILEQLDKFQPISDGVVRQFIQNSSAKNFDVKPSKSFLPQYKTPCWYETITNKKKFVCLPSFYIAGFPKSATSDVWNRLITHPMIASGSRKEPHFWTRHDYYNDHYLGVPMSTYVFKWPRVSIRKIKKNPSKPILLCDGSVSTIWDNTYLTRALERKDKYFEDNKEAIETDSVSPLQFIKAYTPNAKFVVMLRNPVDRAYSDYLYFPTASKKSHGHFQLKINASIDHLKSCLLDEKRPFRRCVYGLNKQHREVKIGLYVVYLSDFMRIFTREHLLVINTDDYEKNMKKTLLRILNFLNIDLQSKDVLKKMVSKKDKNKRRPSKKKFGEINPKNQQILRDFYAPFNQALAELLSDKRYSEM